ncbi:MAG: hypothetical protein AAFP86_03190 [Planctomycetota bacterium]
MFAALLTTLLLAAPSEAIEPLTLEASAGAATVPAAMEPATTVPAQLPREADVPSALRQQRVAVSIELTQTHFLARNHDVSGAWVVFGNEELRFRDVRPLGAGARLEYVLPQEPEFAAGAWTVEVVTRSEASALVRSGSAACDELRGRTAWFVRDGGPDLDGLTGWVATHGGRALSRLRARFAAAHVPVPLPSENNRRSKARPLERKKLPPV